MASPFQIYLSSKTSEIIREYPEGIPLIGPYEVGLKHFVCWNTVYNINQTNNTLTLVEITTKNERIKHHIVIPSGYYELDDLIIFLNGAAEAKFYGFFISLSRRLLNIKLWSMKADIDFTPDNSVGKILGFSKKVIPFGTPSTSDKPVDIFSINTIKIGCNLVRSNIDDLKRNVNTLYDFPLDSSKVGGKIIKEPNPICYFSVNTDKIHELVIKITDQNNNLIDFREETITLTLDFRPVRYAF
jgi:hypothetical protein